MLSVLRRENIMATTKMASETPEMAKRAASLSFKLMIAGKINNATKFITLINGLRAGPAVSLNGSPTVSPMTAALCASEPLPPW